MEYLGQIYKIYFYFAFFFIFFYCKIILFIQKKQKKELYTIKNKKIKINIYKKLLNPYTIYILYRKVIFLDFQILKTLRNFFISHKISFFRMKNMKV